MLYVYWLHTEVIILIRWVKYIIFYKKEPKNKASLVAQPVKRLSAMQGTWVGKIPWRRKWQPTPVFLPGKSHGLWSLVGYCPWGRKESDMTEWLHFHFEEQGREEWAVEEGAGARSPRISPFSSPCPVLSLNGEQRPSSKNSHSQSPPASASRGAAERTSPGRSWWMTVPLGGDPRLEWLTKGVIGAASDNSGFSEHLACAWPERQSSPHKLLGSSPCPGGRAVTGRRQRLLSLGTRVPSSHAEAGAQALLGQVPRVRVCRQVHSTLWAHQDGMRWLGRCFPA